MPHLRTLLLAVGALAAVSASCGSSDSGASDAGDATRTIKAEMVDIAFKPARVTVAKGETVRFVFENNGKTQHEAFLGTPAEQTDHDEKMTGGSTRGGHDMGGMGGGTDTAVTVEPGKTEEFTTRFDDAGTFEIGCHEPGHYTAGMKITVTVS